MPTLCPRPKGWGLYFCLETSGQVHLFPVAVPGIFLAVKTTSSSADRGHSLASFLLPQAAVGLLPIPNTEVKLMYPCCGARRMSSATVRLRPSPTAATRSARFICRRQRSARSPGKIGNANTRASTEMWRLFALAGVHRTPVDNEMIAIGGTVLTLSILVHSACKTMITFKIRIALSKSLC